MRDFFIVTHVNSIRMRHSFIVRHHNAIRTHVNAICMRVNSIRTHHYFIFMHANAIRMTYNSINFTIFLTVKLYALIASLFNLCISVDDFLGAEKISKVLLRMYA